MAEFDPDPLHQVRIGLWARDCTSVAHRYRPRPRRQSLGIATGILKSPAGGNVATSSKPRTVPAFITPMAAQSVAELPEGDDWIYELKLDGLPYRETVIADMRPRGPRGHRRLQWRDTGPNLPITGSSPPRRFASRCRPRLAPPSRDASTAIGHLRSVIALESLS